MRLKNELWKSVGVFKGVDYTGWYEISSKGRVKGLDRIVTEKNGKTKRHKGQIMCPGVNKGYLMVVLKKNGVNKNAQIHQLVALAFLPNPHHYTIVNHKDRNPKNNDVNNLEWCTNQYNLTYMDAHIQRGLNESIGITQLTLDGQFVKNWTSSVEAGKDKRFTQSGVNYCVNCNCNQYKGYVWIKTSVYNTMSPEDIKRYCTIFLFHNNGIGVKQVTENGEIIRVWKNMLSAARGLNGSRGKIKYAIKYKTMYLNTYWDINK